MINTAMLTGNDSLPYAVSIAAPKLIARMTIPCKTYDESVRSTSNVVIVVRTSAATSCCRLRYAARGTSAMLTASAPVDAATAVARSAIA